VGLIGFGGGPAADSRAHPHAPARESSEYRGFALMGGHNVVSGNPLAASFWPTIVFRHARASGRRARIVRRKNGKKTRRPILKDLMIKDLMIKDLMIKDLMIKDLMIKDLMLKDLMLKDIMMSPGSNTGN
jgi:pentapeptide MXKDX repeat protein